MDHASHTSQLARLNRIQGQVGGLIRMVQEERYCADILTQIRAVQAALRGVEQQVLQGHIRTCVADAIRGDDMKQRESKLAELFTLLKRFAG